MKTIKFKNIKKALSLSSLMIGLAFMLCISYSCNESSIGQQPLDKAAPPAPTNAVVENLNGGAVIKYDIPVSDDLLYVKATYKIKNTTRESKSTYYTNSIEVSGFGDTKEYEVELRSVDRSRNESEPLIVTINPLTPPVDLISDSFNLLASFGGVQLTWENNTRADIIISFMASDSTGVLVDVEDVYSSVPEGKHTLRGFDTTEREFAVYARDRWDNYSDTVSIITTPYFEEEVDKSTFKEAWLPGDAASTGHRVAYIWDNIIDVGSGFWHTNAEDLPIRCTFDMGVTAQLSRYKLWQRPGFYYTHNNPKKWELWGSINPNPDGSLDESWTLLDSYESFKPSGDGPLTNEDKEYAEKGEEFEVPIDAPAVRYIRFVMYENWSGGNIAQIAEMSFWGDTKK